MDDNLSGSTSKIITLQIGHFSNFVGTHWWNIQNSSRGKVDEVRPHGSVQHDIMFREGLENGRNIVHTPRLLCIDLKGSLKTLNEDGTVHMSEDRPLAQSDPSSMMDSEEDLSVFRTEGYKKNEFLTELAEGTKQSGRQTQNNFSGKLYDLNDAVDVWSDYLGTSYHHQSVLLVDNYMHSQDMNNFNMFGLGYSMNTDNAFWDSWEDRMHFFAEECDTLQGFQVLVDLDDGFGGLGTRVLQNLQDLFGQKTITVFGTLPGSASSLVEENKRLVNIALSVSHLTQESTLFTPLSLQKNITGKQQTSVAFPHLSYNANLPYHSSAILASFVDSISLQYRSGSSRLGDFCNSITRTGHKIAAAGLSLPLVAKSKSISDLLSPSVCLYRESVLQCLTPSHANALNSLYSQQVVLRGFPLIHEPRIAAKRATLRANSNIDAFEKYMYSNYTGCLTGTTFSEEGLTTTQPYPQFFNPEINKNGWLQGSRSQKEIVSSSPTMASLYTSDGLFDTLRDIIVSARNVSKSTIAVMEQNGVENDELKESFENLTDLAYLYDEKRATDLL